MKVLFLDIDGVVNSKETLMHSNGVIGIDPYRAFLVGKIQLDTGCEVVLSSSWRNWPEGEVEIENRIVKLYDKTPVLEGERGEEIQAWLDNHPEVTQYAILDDNSDFLPGQHLFQTSFDIGLTEEIAKAVTDHLNAIENTEAA